MVIFTHLAIGNFTFLILAPHYENEYHSQFLSDEASNTVLLF